MTIARVQRYQLKIELFARLVERGFTNRKACEVAGISQSTAQKWLRAGQSGDSRFVEFFHKYVAAQAHLVELAAMTLEDVMLNGTNEGARVKAATYVLERAAGWAVPKGDDEPEDIIDAEPIDGALTPKAVAAMSPDQLAEAIREVGRMALDTSGDDQDGLWGDD